MGLKRKIFLISLAFGILNIATIVFFLFPFLRDIKNSFNELATIKKESASSQELLGNINKIRDIYRGIEADSNKINNLFVDQAVPIGIIEFWENTADSEKIYLNPSSIILRNVENEKEKKSSPWNFLLFQMNLKGAFPDFLKFLVKNENGPYLTEVRTVNMHRIETDSLTEVDANLGGKIFTK